MGLQDTWFRGIGPSSPILYILFSTNSGSCQGQDIFENVAQQAVECTNL